MHKAKNPFWFGVRVEREYADLIRGIAFDDHDPPLKISSVMKAALGLFMQTPHHIQKALAEEQQWVYNLKHPSYRPTGWEPTPDLAGIRDDESR